MKMMGEMGIYIYKKTQTINTIWGNYTQYNQLLCPFITVAVLTSQVKGGIFDKSTAQPAKHRIKTRLKYYSFW